MHLTPVTVVIRLCKWPVSEWPTAFTERWYRFHAV